MNETIFSLPAGKRLIIKPEYASLLVTKGLCEVYATAKNDPGCQQLFLEELPIGSTAFPPKTKNDGLEFFIYAAEDSELTIRPIEEYTIVGLRSAARHWFASLISLPWLQQLVSQKNHILSLWRSENFLTEIKTKAELEKMLDYNQTVLSRLLVLRFNKQNNTFSAHLKNELDYKQHLIDQSIGNLLLENPIPYRKKEAAAKTEISDVTMIVRQAAIYLKMPENAVTISPELAKNLSQRDLIKRLVQKGNMSLREVTLPEGWHTHDCGTLIGYYGPKKELAAIMPVDEASYRMVTVSHPEGFAVTDSIAAELDASAFQCYANFPTTKLTVKDLLLFIIRRCWKNDYFTIIAISFFAGLIPLATPVITETIFSDIIPLRDRQSLAAVAQVMIVAGFTTAGMALARSIAVMRITSHVDLNVEAALWNRLLSLPVSFFRRFQSGEILQRMNGIEAIKSLITGDFVAQVFNTVFSFWSLFLMAWYSFQLTVEAIIVWLIYFVVVAFIYRRLINFQTNLIKAANKTSGLVQQIFNGLEKFRLHGAEEQAFYLWSRVFGEQWKWKLKLRWQSNYSAIICSVQPFILTMLLYYTAVYGLTETDAAGRVIKSMDYAKFLAFQAAFSSFNATLTSLIPLAAKFFTIRPHIDNLRPIIEELPEMSEEKADSRPLTGAMKISHLSFSYREDLPLVLDDISFKVKPGEKLAIVGRSGCGKTTLMRLLLGMEKPVSGAVYYDGQDLSTLNLPSVRCQLGVVMQNGQLMTGDIFSNIIGSTSLTLDDAWDAAEKAGIAEDIRQMPMGMHTIISEGSTNISGGQRQRLLIARAIVNHPAIIVLDEATSALDNRTQAIVQESLDKMQTTMLIVAHRLSTIRNADHIIVLDEGKLVEEGTYDELVKMNGIFTAMVNRQIA